MIKVAFVDPLVSPDTIAAGLKKYQFHSIAVFSNFDKAKVKDRFKPALFDEVIYLQNENDLSALRSAGIKYLFNGDFNIELSDRLAHQLCEDFANNPATSLNRYNKLHFPKALEQHNVQTPKILEIAGQTLNNAEKEILKTWQFPIILKPGDAGGTEGFFECQSIEEAEANLKNRLTEYWRGAVVSYIAQEKLIGTEYAIDTFSLQGKHQLIHIREYKKEHFDGKTPISRNLIPIFPEHPLWESLNYYILNLLDAVELQNGFCHTEVFVTKDGIFATDINPRLPGAKNSNCIFTQETYGLSHMDVLCHALLKKPLPAPDYKPGMLFYLHTHKLQTINEIKMDKLFALASFKHCIPNVEFGTVKDVPQKLADTIAFIVLAHDDAEQVQRDYQTLLSLEKNNELF